MRLFPAADTVVKKAEWLARPVTFEPKRDLAEVHCERIQINTIDAMRYYVAYCKVELAWLRLILPSTNASQFFAQSPCCRQQKVSRAASGIADCHAEDGFDLPVAFLDQVLASRRFLGLLDARFHHRHKRAFHQLVHQFWPGVIRAGGLAFHSHAELELQTVVCRLHNGLIIQQALIYRAKFFHVECRVVHSLDKQKKPQQVAAAQEIAQQFRFFHWHLEFPEVFESGGLDVVLGNPPWERLNVQEKEFFASRAPDVARAANKAVRSQMLRQLALEMPELWNEYQSAVRSSASLDKFIRGSLRFVLTAQGDINTYVIFAELGRTVIKQSRKVGHGAAYRNCNRRYHFGFLL